MFTKWEKGMLADLVHDEITRLRGRGYPMLEDDLWNIYHKLEEMD